MARTVAIAALMGAMGCLGSVSAPGGGGGPTTADGGIPETGKTATGAPCAPSTTARRVFMLSRTEYDSTVAAALGDTSNVAAATFPAETRANNFKSNDSALTVDTTFMNEIKDAAESLAANNAAKQVTAVKCTFSTSPSATTPDPCAVTYINQVGTAFFRRPLTTAEVSDMYSAYVTGFQNPYPSTDAKTSGVELVLTSLLESPQFLYRTELGDPSDTTSATVSLTQYELAAALSYAVTGGPPDATLAGLAAAGSLDSPSALLAQYTRLVATPAGHSRMQQFFLEWLGADQISEAGSASSTLTTTVAADMLTESQTYVDQVMYSGPGTLKEILTGNYTYVNSDLAKYYGITPADSSSTFNKVTAPNALKSGILSQGSFLATSGANGVNILHRGVLLREKLFCEQLPSVASLGLPGFVPPPLGTPGAGQDTRDLLEKTIPSGSPCYACHQYFMTMGFGLDNFDPLGKFRSTENSVTIDPSGTIGVPNTLDPASGIIGTPTMLTTSPFTGYTDLVGQLADDPQVGLCFSKNIVAFTSGRTDLQNDNCDVANAADSFTAAGGGVVAGFSDYIQSKAFTQRAR